MSQTHQILEHLKNGNTITPLEALGMFGVFRLSERIREIEKQGYIIEREWKNYKPNGSNKWKRIMKYRLQNPFTEL